MQKRTSFRKHFNWKHNYLHTCGFFSRILILYHHEMHDFDNDSFPLHFELFKVIIYWATPKLCFEQNHLKTFDFSMRLAEINWTQYIINHTKQSNDIKQETVLLEVGCNQEIFISNLKEGVFHSVLFPISVSTKYPLRGNFLTLNL